MLELNRDFHPKDFIQTAEGLCFAVVQKGTEFGNGQEKVLCFLRYVKGNPKKEKLWRKVTTGEANDYLKQHFPVYLHHSAILDAHLHGVGTSRIVHHHKPKDMLQQILSGEQQRDEVEQDLRDLCSLFEQQGLDLTKAGITGSLLIGAQQQESDIDLVFYDWEIFHKARAITASLISKQQLDSLSDKDWQEAYDRRSCALSFQEYVWHESRKFNKALINRRKFDLNFVAETIDSDAGSYKKYGSFTIKCKITEDQYSFDYPALYSIDHETITTVICFIATYTGQAFIGETVEVSGLLEQAEDGSKRIVVGSSREAPGEYIKVI